MRVRVPPAAFFLGYEGMTQEWIERAKETARFHRANCILTPSWNLRKTAKALRRSLGSISEDLKIVSWLKTHPNQLERFEHAYEALAYIRKKSKEINMDDLDA